MMDSPNPPTTAACPKCSRGMLSFENVYGPAQEAIAHSEAIALMDVRSKHRKQELQEQLANELSALDQKLPETIANLDEELQLEAQLSAIERRTAVVIAQLKTEFRSKVKSLPSRNHPPVYDREDEAAFLMIADNPEQALQEVYRRRGEELRRAAAQQQQALKEAYQRKHEELRTTYELRTYAVRSRYAKAHEQEDLDSKAAIEQAICAWETPAHCVAVVYCTGCGHVVAACELPGDRAGYEEQSLQGLQQLSNAVQAMHRDIVTCLQNLTSQLQTSGSNLAALNAREETRSQTARVQAAVSGVDRWLNGE